METKTGGETSVSVGAGPSEGERALGYFFVVRCNFRAAAAAAAAASLRVRCRSFGIFDIFRVFPLPLC